MAGLLTAPNTEPAALKTEPPAVELEGLPNPDPNTVPAPVGFALVVVCAEKPEGTLVVVPNTGALEPLEVEAKPAFGFPVPKLGAELETDVLNPCVEEALDPNTEALDPDVPKMLSEVLLNLPVFPFPVLLEVEPNPGADPKPAVLKVLGLKPVLLAPVSVTLPVPKSGLAVVPDPKP